jgi:hypothetical protein
MDSITSLTGANNYQIYEMYFEYLHSIIDAEVIVIENLQLLSHATTKEHWLDQIIIKNPLVIVI